MEGFRLLGLLKVKENLYLGCFSWTQGTLRFNVEKKNQLDDTE
jgi:virulence-associated protein VapD